MQIVGAYRPCKLYIAYVFSRWSRSIPTTTNHTHHNIQQGLMVETFHIARQQGVSLKYTKFRQTSLNNFLSLSYLRLYWVDSRDIAWIPTSEENFYVVRSISLSPRSGAMCLYPPSQHSFGICLSYRDLVLKCSVMLGGQASQNSNFLP